MKIILVGMYNKPHKTPLCGSTKTGKLLNRVQRQVNNMIPNIPFLRTNLYNTEHFPPSYEEKQTLAWEWYSRIQPDYDDIIILLGHEVHKNFITTGLTTSNHPHPASQRSHEQMNNYVFNMTKDIVRLVYETQNEESFTS